MPGVQQRHRFTNVNRCRLHHRSSPLDAAHAEGEVASWRRVPELRKYYYSCLFLCHREASAYSELRRFYYCAFWIFFIEFVGPEDNLVSDHAFARERR
jgi:hypothetical protein